MPKPKLPKRRKDLNVLLNASYNDGYRVAREQVEREAKARIAQLQEERNKIHLDALREVTKMASTFGQFIGEISRAMQSEKGQL